MLAACPLKRSVVVSAVVVLFIAGAALGDDWPQWRGVKRDGVWHETGIVEKFQKPRLEYVWRADLGSGYCGPTVAEGRVHVMDRVVSPKQIERVHCFDAKTGESLWTHSYDCAYRGVQYDAGPRASVTIHDGRAYALGTMGHLHCLDAGSGKVLFSRDLNSTYGIRMPIWGISAAPLIEGDLLILQIGGEDGACVVALDRESGKEVWRALKDEASYSAPIVIEQAGKRVLVVYTGENVVGLDPPTGKVYWKHPFPPTRMVIGIATPVLHRDLLFLSNFFDGSLLLKVRQDEPAVTKVWQRAGESEEQTDALHSIIATPYLEGDYIYGVDSYGELRCLNLETGDRVWESLEAVPKARWATIHFVKNHDNVWMFNEKGELIIAELSPEGFQEKSRAFLIEPTRDQLPSRRGGVAWSHPAFADRHVFARNDKELVCASLAKGR